MFRLRCHDCRVDTYDAERHTSWGKASYLVQEKMRVIG